MMMVPQNQKSCLDQGTSEENQNQTKCEKKKEKYDFFTKSEKLNLEENLHVWVLHENMFLGW